jgi:hypothetical protein
MSGGTELIRQALKARNSKVNLSLFAKDLGMNGDTVHAFLNGGDLKPDIKKAMAEYLWPHMTYNPELDVVQPITPQIPKPVGNVLPQLDPKLIPKYQAGACQTSIRPVKDQPQPKPNLRRPRWIGGWW